VQVADPGYVILRKGGDEAALLAIDSGELDDAALAGRSLWLEWRTRTEEDPDGRLAVILSDDLAEIDMRRTVWDLSATRPDAAAA
jgi:hypothetical protein